MKTIPLTERKVALVDDEDYKTLIKYKWQAVKWGNNWYAVRVVYHYLSMHQCIMGKKRGLEIDHISGNSLDNQRHNLSFRTHSQNIQNSHKCKGNFTSKYKGVAWERWGKRKKRWRAKLMQNYKIVYYGYFDNEIEAAIAYDQAARKYFGEFAYTNF